MFNVILPTYNEAQNIFVLIKMLEDIFTQLKYNYLIIIVDDNSEDGTRDIIKNIHIPNIKLIERPTKLGLGSAYKSALVHCIYEFTIILDADLQHNPFDIIGMHKYCNQYDIIASTRYNKITIELTNNKYIDIQGKVYNWSLIRKFISSFSNTLVQFVLDLKTSDVTSSFRIYKTMVLQDLISQVRNNGFGFQMEIIARAEHNNYTIKEYPITFYSRIHGNSKLCLTEIFQFIVILLQLYFVI